MDRKHLGTTFRLLLLSCMVLGGSGCHWTKLLSVNSAAEQGNATSKMASISANGRFVAFESNSNNLVDEDFNGWDDIFVYDLVEGTLKRASVNSNGIEANSACQWASISGDGRFIAFQSRANNLVAGDTGKSDVFVRDMVNGTTSRVSVSNTGTQSNGDSRNPAISRDGRYIAFWSEASNLVANDTNGTNDVFVYDRINGTTKRVSVNNAGNEGNLSSNNVSISGDGRFIAFESIARNLVADDTNSTIDIFVRDMVAGTTTRISVDSFGFEANDGGSDPSISDDGRYITFESFSGNLVPADTNDNFDIFVHDTVAGTTSRVSVDSFGVQGNSSSYDPVISGDGRYVAFSSQAGNLVEGDNYSWNVYVHDRGTGNTRRITSGPLGEEGDSESAAPTISTDGRYVAFDSWATNLVSNDINELKDVFIRAVPEVSVTSISPDRLTIGATSLVTIMGSDFLQGAIPYVAGTQIRNIEIVDENTITAEITVQAGSPVGAQNVVVGLPGTGAGPLTGAVGTCTNCVTLSPPPGC